MNHDVIVIGAGISGLTTAHNLLSRGYNVQVLERQANIGGNATSARFNGFLMEHGPTTMNAAMPEAMAFIRSLGLDQALVNLGPDVIKRYLRDERGLHGISTHPLGFFLSGYLPLTGRLAMLAEILQPCKKDGKEESIHDFATRRFGRQFADKVIDPMTAGIFMGDSKALSINSAFPRLPEMEQKYGSITRGIIAARRGSEPGRQLFSWPKGIGTLPKSIAASLKQNIHTNTAVIKISSTATGYKVHTANSSTLHARAVVLAVQPHVSAALLETMEPQTASALSNIQAPPIAVVFAGYHKSQVSHPLDGLGFLSTSIKNKIMSGAQFSSTMFTNRAPEDHVAISCYVGGARNPQAAVLPEQDLTNAVQKELSDLLGIKGSPVVSRTKYWSRGLPHYTLGHDTRKEIIETANQRLPGLFLTGNYLRGVSVASCIESANITAENVNSELHSTNRHSCQKFMMAKRSI